MVPWGGPAVVKPWLKQNQFPRFQGGFTPGLGVTVPPPQWRTPRNPPQTIPATFQVDENARYTGTVMFYQKWKGYGFIEIAQTGVIPTDKLFVHWKQLQSDDRFPFLQKGMEVEFGLLTQREWSRPGLTIRAKNVTLVGGMSLALQDDIDAQEKAFVGGQHLRYTGTLKFFSPRHGFGYVIMDQGYDVDPSVPNEMRVDNCEVNAGGNQPRFMENIAVEFGIYRTPRGGYKVYNMTLPGGHPLTQDALENRISMGPQSFTGEVVIWNWRGGWGFVRVDPNIVLPPRVTAKLAQQQQMAKSRGKTIHNDKAMYFRKEDCAPRLMMQRGMQVQFQLYIDDKGAGACDIRA